MTKTKNELEEVRVLETTLEIRDYWEIYCHECAYVGENENEACDNCKPRIAPPTEFKLEVKNCDNCDREKGRG